MNTEKLLKNIRERSDLTTIAEINKNGATINISREDKTGKYYLVILDADYNMSKKLIRMILNNYHNLTPKEISFDNIYDIDSLTSANSLEELLGKMLYIERGCIK